MCTRKRLDVLPIVLLLLVGVTPAAFSRQGTTDKDGVNLLLNADLSEGLLSPRAWGFNASQDNRASWERLEEGGRFSVVLEGCGRDWAGLSSWSFDVEPGQRVRVCAWMRRVSKAPLNERDALYVRFFRNGVFLGQEGPSLKGLGRDWELVQGDATAPQNCNQADVSVQLWSKAAVRIDSLSAVREGNKARGSPAPIPSPPGKKSVWVPVTEPQNLPRDEDSNGLPDVLERFLGIEPGDRARSVLLSRRKTTSFQTATGYREDNDVKTDVAIVADNQALKIESWEAMGYEPHVMAGFRAGPAYLEEHPDEAQTDREGRRLTCGPNSFYMVPTENRRRIFSDYFKNAAERGAKAACPEEPEFFGSAGYSEAFKREWRAFYGKDWQDPVSSVDARYKAARLMTRLETLLLESCWEGARQARSDIQRFLLTHTPLNYAHWGIVFGHHDTLQRGDADAVIAQVWTGTARTPVTYAGESRERTFENAYLEYASAVGLVQGMDLDLWFLMDPLEDNPDRTMEDYRTNYRRTLVAALQFPQVVRYETMPWPTRIYGRVPDAFATEIGSAIHLLSDMQRFETEQDLPCASKIGVFLSDTALWQRSPPHASSMDSFYGLSLPLVMKGIPISVPHLDRVADPGYLDGFRLLFLSYDPMKPKTRHIDESLANWVKQGGVLLLFGGENPYNAVSSWWREDGYASPQDHLLERCGWDVSRRKVLQGLADPKAWTVVAESVYKGRDLGNRTLERIDLSPFLSQGTLLVKCEDSDKQDGWGAYLSGISYSGLRKGSPVRGQILPNSGEERSVMYLDQGTGVHPAARFCDRNSFVIYKFSFDPRTRATLELDLGNEYRVSVLSGEKAVLREFRAVSKETAPWGETVEWQATDPLVVYDHSGSAPLYVGEQTLLSEKRHGQGWVVFCGTPPDGFARSEVRADQLRGLARYAWETKTGLPWTESSCFLSKRGPYLAVKTLDEPLTLKGPFLDLFDSLLPVLYEKSLDEDEAALLMRIPKTEELSPSLLFSSSCVEWRAIDRSSIRLIVSGPAQTAGSCRLGLGQASVKSVRSWTVRGESDSARPTQENGTLLLQYPNEPEGLAIRVLLRPSP